MDLLMTSFCMAPFDIFEISLDGNVHCCCADWLPTPLGNIFKSSALEIWNSEIAQDIRRTILDGSYKYCTRCPYLLWPHTPERERPALVLNKIPTLRLCYDRTCNLACPSCRREPIHTDTAQITRVHKATLQSHVLDIAQRVFLTGSGDPLASPTYFKFLQNLPNLAPHLKIALLTNGLLLDESHMNTLGSALEQITEIGISVDGATPETYALNRGGSWTKLWHNIDLINRRLQLPGRKFSLYMCYVIQANNFRELVPFIELAFSHQVEWIIVYYLRNWSVFTEAEYKTRAVHLPEHPDYAEFGQLMTNKRLTSDSRLRLPIFPSRDI
jgi:sulfatase maturation enzyme AslB (radical SAM superfamily)